jgi:hypothetical protein
MSCVVVACWGKWPPSRTWTEANIRPDRSHSRNLASHMQKPNQGSGARRVARQENSEREAAQTAVEPLSCCTVVVKDWPQGRRKRLED